MMHKKVHLSLLSVERKHLHFLFFMILNFTRDHKAAAAEAAIVYLKIKCYA